jgi:hypothetical protein
MQKCSPNLTIKESQVRTTLSIWQWKQNNDNIHWCWSLWEVRYHLLERGWLLSFWRTTGKYNFSSWNSRILILLTLLLWTSKQCKQPQCTSVREWLVNGLQCGHEKEPKLVMVVNTYNPSNQEAEARWSLVQGQQNKQTTKDKALPSWHEGVYKTVRWVT